MRCGVCAIAVMLVVTLGMGGCASQPESTVEPDSTKKVAVASDSILAFDDDENSAKLVADMEAGNIPTECTVLYDQMGALPSVTVTDEETIREVYDRLAQVTVVGESPYSITDNYHSVSFVLQDGTSMGFRFEGEGLLSRGQTNYEIKGSGPLWAYVRTLQAGVTGGKSVYAINVQDDAGVVLECPLSAEEGSEVRVLCSTENSDDIHVYANGEEITRSVEISRTVGGSDVSTPANKRRFEFFMPATDVDLTVTVGSAAS